MFFRTKTIKGTSLLQLVQSYRNAEGQPQQRVLVSLGDVRLPHGEEAVNPELAFAGRFSAQEVFDWSEEALPAQH